MPAPYPRTCLVALGLLACVLASSLTSVAAAPHPEEGLSLVRVYARNERCAQSDFRAGFAHRGNGLLYYGNHLGLLEFDGRNWRPLVSSPGYCRAIAEGPQEKFSPRTTTRSAILPRPTAASRAGFR